MIDEPIDDYLWDRTGDADEEICELERLLSTYRHDRPLRPPIVDDARVADESDT